MNLPRALKGALAAALIVPLAATGACRRAARTEPRPKPAFAPFNFQIEVGADHYNIEGFIAHAAGPGRLPALLVLTAGEGNARRCIEQSGGLVAMGMLEACISIPGYGKSSGPSRFVGPQAVEAAHRAVDLMAVRPDVDPDRIAVWGLSDGAVAAGLLMDSDPRLRAVILQSGFYDTLKMWPEAPLREKVTILRQVFPSHRVLAERSVIAHLPPKLDCSVLIMHGEHDKKMPVQQAKRLAQELQSRGAKVETRFFDDGHDLGGKVDGPLKEFLRENLIAAGPRAHAPS
ncbi:MAG TPA: prolyl oligopeptidase family serine peptidase [Candidatus Binataceae bacterium]|nr:prolyl oligopeptidase family serine peptidase [Candidatus Binataceae bacterium]